MGLFCLAMVCSTIVYMKNKGFTLVELIISIGIIALLLAIVLASVKSSKNKSADAETKKVVAEIALKAEGQEIAPGVTNYQAAFTAVGATTALTQLAAKYSVPSGAALGAYDYSVTATDYAILFPLKKGGYYCVDSYGQATAKEVVGQFQTTGAKTCATATRTTPPTNTMPVLTLTAPTTVGYGVHPATFTYNGQSVYGVPPSEWAEPSYTATDAEDGNITSSVQIEFPDAWRDHASVSKRSVLGVIRGFIATGKVEAKGPSCLGMTTRHYYVTDSAGNTAHAYRDFTASC